MNKLIVFLILCVGLGFSIQKDSSVGSAVTPNYTFTSDTDTGMYRKAANVLGFTAGGIQRATIDASGITSPTVNGTKLIGNGAGITGIVLAGLPSTVLTNNYSGNVTLSGTIVATVSTANNVGLSALPSSVVTSNYLSSVTLGNISVSAVNNSGTSTANKFTDGTASMTGGVVSASSIQVNGNINSMTLGFGAGGVNTNTFLGTQANDNGTSVVGRTTGYGYQALQKLQSGLDNVAIGYRAGLLNQGGAFYITTADNCVFLGSNITPKTGTPNNSIIIGKAAIGEGDNTTVLGNSSILTTHIYGAITSNLLFAAIGTGTFGDKAMSRIHMRSTDLSNGLAQIGFGYSEGALPAAAIAYKEVNNSGSTYGDLMLGVKKDSGATTTADAVITIQGGQGGGQVNIVATVSITGAYTASNQPFLSAYMGSNGATMTKNVAYVVTWDTVVVAQGGMTLNAGTITVPANGTYLITTMVYPENANYINQQLSIVVDGAEKSRAVFRPLAGVNNNTSIQTQWVGQITAGKTVVIKFISDVNSYIVGSISLSYVQITRLF